MGRKKKATGTAWVGSPQLICGESYTEATAKLPENAGITHWGSRVITESFCPHLPTVIRLTAQQLRRQIIKIHRVWLELVIFCRLYWMLVNVLSSRFCHCWCIFISSQSFTFRAQMQLGLNPCTLCIAISSVHLAVSDVHLEVIKCSQKVLLCMQTIECVSTYSCSSVLGCEAS